MFKLTTWPTIICSRSPNTRSTNICSNLQQIFDQLIVPTHNLTNKCLTVQIRRNLTNKYSLPKSEKEKLFSEFRKKKKNREKEYNLICMISIYLGVWFRILSWNSFLIVARTSNKCVQCEILSSDQQLIENLLAAAEVNHLFREWN